VDEVAFATGESRKPIAWQTNALGVLRAKHRKARTHIKVVGECLLPQWPHFLRILQVIKEFSVPQIQPSFLSLLQAAPSSNRSLFEAYERREQATPNGLLFHMFSCFGRKSPDTCSFWCRLRKRAAIEAPRLISAAWSLSVSSSPASPRRRLSVFCPLLESQPFILPGQRLHGRRYESALWLSGEGALCSAVGSWFDGELPLGSLDWGCYGWLERFRQDHTEMRLLTS